MRSPTRSARALSDRDSPVIYEVDEALRALVRQDALPGSDVEVVFDAPTKEWASRRNTPTVDVYLYDIREDLRRRERGMINDYDSAGRVVDRRLPPRYFKLSYLVTAWTQRPEDEHRLLSAILACFLRHDAIPADLLEGPLAELALPVAITVGLPPPEDRGFADVWSALGGELKPSLDVVIATPIDSGQRRPAGPPVSQPVTVTAGGLGGWPGTETRQGRTASRRGQLVTGIGLDYLAGRVSLVEGRVRTLVAHRRLDDPNPEDPFRGLYLSDEAVDRLLRPSLPAAAAAERRTRARRASLQRSRAGRRTRPAAAAGPGRGPRRPGRRIPGRGARAGPRQPVRAAVRVPQRRRHPPARHRRPGPGTRRGARARPPAPAPGWPQAARCSITSSSSSTMPNVRYSPGACAYPTG